LAPFVSLALLAGCSSENRMNTGTNDPLFGGPAPKPAGAVLGPPGAPVAVPPGRAAAPLPAVTSATSTAALASGTAPLLPGAQDLRIAAPAQMTSSGGWQGQPAPQSATLRQPEPVSPPKAALAPLGSLPATAIGAARITTFEQAQDELKARKVGWQSLVFFGERNEWQYRCSVPNKDNPSVSRTYQFSAPDPLGAMRAVLDEIDRDHR
jgi:hypothetical protein